MNVLKNVKKIAVGMSGGVDSAVSAFLLKKQGYEVIGLFMKNWDIADEVGFCSSDADANDAAYVCNKLDIPYYEVNFVKHYWNEVFQNLIMDYQNGVTPNPDILCNKHIKFKRFCDYSINILGCDMIATGHYARRTFPKILDGKTPAVRLLKARDAIKDQTFFLSQIPQSALQKTLFPLGDYLKSSVKNIAAINGLEKIANKKESMGICFIGSRNFQNFIDEYIDSKEGDFIDIDSGKIVGRHYGKHHFTVGQRCRVGGYTDRLYVARKTENEDILVALGHDHPAFYGKYICTTSPHWIHSSPRQISNGAILNCSFRFQHRDPLVKCCVFQKFNGELMVILDEPLRALTPGQYAVFYIDDECLGSSQILYVGPTEFSLKCKEIDMANEVLINSLSDIAISVNDCG